MTVLAVERIKLFSTRSPYWCLLLIVAVTLGFAILAGLQASEDSSILTSQIGTDLGQMVFMVLAALAVTTEYRFGTIRSTLLAIPGRARVLIGKTALVILLGAAVGGVAGLAAFFLTKVLSGSASMTLSTGDDWRMVVGHAATFAVGGVVAVAIGTLVRQSAGALSILLLWPLLVENLIGAVPGFRDLKPWLPFSAGERFTALESVTAVEGEGTITFNGPTPLQGLAVYAATAVVLWIVALLVLKRRDA